YLHETLDLPFSEIRYVLMSVPGAPGIFVELLEYRGDVVEVLEDINIGVAIALDEGLIAPALLNCRHRGIDDLAEGLRDLVTRTRSGKLRTSEIAEGSFTLS